MSQYWKRDDRIDEGTALRDLEKKVHYCMMMLANAGIAVDASGGNFGVPDDMENNDVYFDADEVRNDQQ